MGGRWKWNWLLVLAIAIAGCGASTHAKPAELTVAQMRTRADAICKRLNEQTIKALNEANNAGGPNQSSAERRAYAELTVTTTGYLRRAAREIDALEAPAKFRAGYASLADALRGVAGGFPTRAETMAYRDPRAKQRDEERRHVAAIAHKLELEVCG